MPRHPLRSCGRFARRCRRRSTPRFTGHLRRVPPTASPPPGSSSRHSRPPPRRATRNRTPPNRRSDAASRWHGSSGRSSSSCTETVCIARYQPAAQPGLQSPDERLRVAAHHEPGFDMEHPSLTSEMPVASPLLTTTGAFRRVEKLEAAVTRREEILSAVAFAATRFLDESDWETNIRDVLDRLGSAAEVSRVYLFELFTDAGGVLRTSQRYEWVAPGVKAEIDNPELQNMDLVGIGLSRWAELLPNGEAIYGVAEDFPLSERAL